MARICVRHYFACSGLAPGRVTRFACSCNQLPCYASENSLLHLYSEFRPKPPELPRFEAIGVRVVDFSGPDSSA
jgi:hypothetical protein